MNDEIHYENCDCSLFWFKWFAIYHELMNPSIVISALLMAYFESAFRQQTVDN